MFSLDIKCPSSKMQSEMCFDNLSNISDKDQIKFIIENRIDYEYAKTILTQYKPNGTIFFQQTWGASPQPLAEWILSDGLQVKLGIQLHKIIWGNNKRK